MNIAVENVIFDLDGTLTDPFLGITHCIRYALEKMRAPIPSDLSWCIGPPLGDTFRALLEKSENKDVDQAIALYRERFGTVGMYENTLYNGTEETLKLFKKRGYQVYLATSKPHFFAKKILEYFQITDFFNGIYGSELDGTRNEKGALLEHLLQEEGINPKKTVMIGDRKYDLIGAQKNNIRAIGVRWGYGIKGELEAENPHFICSSFEELQSCIINFSTNKK